MIKIDNGQLELSGTSGEVTVDLVTLLLAINENPILLELLKAAEANVERLVKEGKYVPNNPSNKS